MTPEITRRMLLAWTLATTLVAGGCEEDPEREAEREAVTACFRAVSTEAKFPSAADFGYYEVTKSGVGYRVVGRVELLNAFGAMIPHRYACRYKGRRAEVLVLRPG